MPGKPALTPKQRASIIADWGSGMTIPAIAKKFNRLPPAIYHIIKPLRTSETPPERIAMKVDWKQEFEKAAIPAVLDGLNCTDDLYKRMEGGFKALKGLGLLLADDQTTITLIGGVPQDWRDRYLPGGTRSNTATLSEPEKQAALPITCESGADPAAQDCTVQPTTDTSK